MNEPTNKEDEAKWKKLSSEQKGMLIERELESRGILLVSSVSTGVADVEITDIEALSAAMDEPDFVTKCLSRFIIKNELPIMILDESMVQTYEAPTLRITGEELSAEEVLEIQMLAEEWINESDVDLRRDAWNKYEASVEGVIYDLRPLFCKSWTMLGASYKGMTPIDTFRCHPKTWESLSDEDKAKFELWTPQL